ATPSNPDNLVAEDLLRQLFTISGRRDGDARVGVKVVNVSSVDEAVHGRVDRGGCATLAVKAVVERSDHLVFAVETGVHVHERTHAVETKRGEAGFLERAEVSAGSLDPEELNRLARDRVDLGA